jgi:hypothetical protein
MKWMKERDLLIAQTMAFVQSVTGKKPDADKPVAKSGAIEPSDAFRPSEAFESVAAAAPMPDIETVLADTNLVAGLQRAAQIARPDLRGDFQSEIRTRVASFRAHQERFLREREEYCSATMAKVRASLREHVEPPRLGK